MPKIIDLKKKLKTVPKQKKYFVIELELIAPVEIVYKIYAEDPEEAMKIMEKNLLSNLIKAPSPKINKARKVQAVVFPAGFRNVVLKRRY